MRILPLSAEVLTVPTELHSAAEEGQVYVFVNSKGPSRGGRIKKQNVWRDFQAIRVKAGLPEFSLRGMRKSYCTNMAEVLPMHVVHELAGHSDIRTTPQYYLRLNPGFIEDARKAVEALTRT